MGAVMGYSEQHSLLLMTTDEEVEAFLNVRASRACSASILRALAVLCPKCGLLRCCCSPLLTGTRPLVLQEKRTMKVGLDLALGVGKKLNENKTMDHTALKKDSSEADAKKAFTISKYAHVLLGFDALCEGNMGQT